MKLKTRVTKKNIAELNKIVNKEGYWSEEVRTYLEQFEYFGARQRLDTKVKSIQREQMEGCC